MIILCTLSLSKIRLKLMTKFVIILTLESEYTYMKLFNRFISGLIYPRDITSFENDKRGFTFLYFIFLVILMIIPSIISVSMSYDLDYETEVEIKKSFVFGEYIPYEIKDNKLVIKDEITDTINCIEYSNYNIFFSINPSFTVPAEYINETNILFFEDGIYLCTPVASTKIIEYKDYQAFEGLDFTLARSGDDSFWNQAYNLLNDIFNTYRGLFITISIIVIVIQSVLIIVIGSLLLTAFGRFGQANYFSFIKHWQIMIYVMTPLVVGDLFATLFSVRLFYYIGLFMTLIYSFGINQDPNRGGQNEL